MEYRKLLIEQNDGIVTLTLNSSETLNSLNSELIIELGSALQQLGTDRSVRVIVLTGAGKAFVAGADIKQMSTMPPDQAAAFARSGQQLLLTIEQLEQPVIAAVNGFALGGGLELALACDFIYASTKAKLGFPEVTLGIMPGFGGTQNLARLIGPNRAKEMIFSGRMITAEQAEAWGIVNRLCEPEQLLEQALATAREIGSVGLRGVAAAKQALVSGLNMSKEDGFRHEAALFGLLFATADQKEGMAAFIEKRKAAFTNN